jgi:hypothetical protein
MTIYAPKPYVPPKAPGSVAANIYPHLNSDGKLGNPAAPTAPVKPEGTK